MTQHPVVRLADQRGPERGEERGVGGRGGGGGGGVWGKGLDKFIHK